MGYFKEHLWPAIVLVGSGALALYGLAGDAYDLWTAGLHPMIWAAICAAIFMGTVIVLLIRFQRSLSHLSGFSSVRASESTVPPRSLGGGAASTRENFQNEELSIWDLAPKGSAMISDKTFTDCAFFGPAIVAFRDHIDADGVTINVVNKNLENHLIQVPEGTLVVGVFGFRRCRFRRCTFTGVSFLGTPADTQKIRDAFSGKKSS
jgi:hypothetical protein